MQIETVGLQQGDPARELAPGGETTNCSTFRPIVFTLWAEDVYLASLGYRDGRLALVRRRVGFTLCCATSLTLSSLARRGRTPILDPLLSFRFLFFHLLFPSPLFHTFWSKRRYLWPPFSTPLCTPMESYICGLHRPIMRPPRYAPTVFDYAGRFPSFASEGKDEGKLVMD